ncbi:MAG TPA: aspartate ammonia-lyase [Thiobacillus sp.]|nr:aspartate ammonia-lyase [Thiobacillus sp.]
MPATRTESDSIGAIEVPADAYWGAQTQRSIENFPFGDTERMPIGIIHAMAIVKQAAARVNRHHGLDAVQADAIETAAAAVAAGDYDDQFPLVIWQTGSGTQTNMNVNEVIAGIANEALTGTRGGKVPVHPNDGVNFGQSSNDSFPTALHIAAALAAVKALFPAIALLRNTLQAKSEAYADIVKIGRTHLQDAVPTTLGQEFAGYAWTLTRCASSLDAVRPALCEIGLGGSAAGTRLNTSPDYPARAAAELAKLTGEPIRVGQLVAQMQSMNDLARLSGEIRNLALELTRISNDLRLLASGPRTGLGEIQLPPVQPGSSIMPGKVNPVMFEMLNQVCFQVLGQDAAVSYMVQAGQMELNVMMPALGSALFDAMDWLSNAMNAATEKNLKGIVVNRERCAFFIHQSVALATLLNTQIGYNQAAEVAKESEKSGRPVRDLVAERGLMSAADFDALVLAAAHGVGSGGGAG